MKMERTAFFDASVLMPYVSDDDMARFRVYKQLKYVKQLDSIIAQVCPEGPTFYLRIPLCVLAQKLSASKLGVLCKHHGMEVKTNTKADIIKKMALTHLCLGECALFLYEFVGGELNTKKDQKREKRPEYYKEYDRKRHAENKEKQAGIPNVCNKVLEHKICREYCDRIKPECFEESGCAVCGCLALTKDMQPLHECNRIDLCVNRTSKPVTVKQRKSSVVPTVEETGPIIDCNLKAVCKKCSKALDKIGRAHV